MKNTCTLVTLLALTALGFQANAQTAKPTTKGTKTETKAEEKKESKAEEKRETAKEEKMEATKEGKMEHSSAMPPAKTAPKSKK